MNRCAKRCPIAWTLNLGCAKSLELATENETLMKAKKQASEGATFNDDDHSKRIKDYDFRVCTWNIRTLNRDGVSNQLSEVLIECRGDISVIQEML